MRHRAVVEPLDGDRECAARADEFGGEQQPRHGIAAVFAERQPHPRFGRCDTGARDDIIIVAGRLFSAQHVFDAGPRQEIFPEQRLRLFPGLRLPFKFRQAHRLIGNVAAQGRTGCQPDQVGPPSLAALALLSAEQQSRRRKQRVPPRHYIRARKPHPAEIVAAVGESPAVVSETVWALFNEGRADLARVVLFTTETGRQLMRGEYDNEANVPRQHRKQPLAHLPARHSAWKDDDLVLALCRLCREWKRPVPAIEIHVPRNDREEIKDIRNDADDRAFGNLVFREIRALTADGKPALHVSIAGGRKTMGTRLAAVLSMFGRPQGLVTRRELEGKGYWCPSNNPAKTRGEQRDGSLRRVNIDDPSAVQLVRQRFWPLRNLIDERALKRVAEFDLEELVQATRAMIDPPPISFRDADCIVQIGVPGKTFCRSVVLQAKQYALYRVLAEIQLAVEPSVSGIEFDNDELRPGYVDASEFGPSSYTPGLTEKQIADTVTAQDFQPKGRRFLEILQYCSPVHYKRDSLSTKEALYKAGASDPVGNWQALRNCLNYDVPSINKKLKAELVFDNLSQHYLIDTHSAKNEYWRIGLKIGQNRILVSNP